ncbi:Uu.00g012140.m01.CDS01 [Anthostomella pinea]|uniref:Uu.00g012140.m01.CDS01 n=1 Tax=Anthostomella pinea TaxID=933095 RepID=A0AAI8VYT5_9PEZI|nr:Uu.00g012140.m01.CDS01 [Anthostomella pinea]
MSLRRLHAPAMRTHQRSETPPPPYAEYDENCPPRYTILYQYEGLDLPIQI